jgi:steroid 5-alpha reductase family enzyme
LWAIGVTGAWALATVLSPLVMTYFLVYATGARPTEKYMAGRPGFDEYRSRTAFFVPYPPRLASR